MVVGSAAVLFTRRLCTWAKKLTTKQKDLLAKARNHQSSLAFVVSKNPCDLQPKPKTIEKRGKKITFLFCPSVVLLYFSYSRTFFSFYLGSVCLLRSQENKGKASVFQSLRQQQWKKRCFQRNKGSE